MKTLVSKLQYSYYEEGEFDNIKARSYEETIFFIKQFPWNQQRGQIYIGLNGPSITIEDGVGNYIKLGIDYHNKFILYYLNNQNKIYCQLENNIEDFEDVIFSFFNSEVIEKKLNKYRDWLGWRKKQFVTQQFEYSFGIRRLLGMMALPIFSGLFMLFILYPITYKESPLIPIVFAIGFNLLFFGIDWVLFIVYYCSYRNTIIKVSKGKDEFYFGKRNVLLKEYNKEEIIKIITYSNIKWPKCPWSEFYIYEIQFKDGSMIKFSNLVLSWFKLNAKFSNQTIHGKHRFIPMIKIN